MQSIVDVTLAVGPDQEAGAVDELAADLDVPLQDQHTSVVDALRVVVLVDLCLQPPVQEALSRQRQNSIQTLLVFTEHTIANHAPQKSITLEHTLGILLIQSQQLTGSRTDLGKSQLSAPNFALATQTILAEELHLLIETLLLVRPTRGLVGLTIVTVSAALRPAMKRNIRNVQKTLDTYYCHSH